MIPGLGTDRCLRRNQCLFTDRDVVGNLDLVIDFAASSDHRSGETGTVDDRSCPISTSLQTQCRSGGF